MLLLVLIIPIKKVFSNQKQKGEKWFWGKIAGKVVFYWGNYSCWQNNGLNKIFVFLYSQNRCENISEDTRVYLQIITDGQEISHREFDGHCYKLKIIQG